MTYLMNGFGLILLVLMAPLMFPVMALGWLATKLAGWWEGR